MDRKEAYDLLTEYTQKEGLIKHALSVEASMREYAKIFKEDAVATRNTLFEEEWGIVGLLHDFDYERFPTAEDHPFRGAEILRKKGVSEEWIKAILGHADYTGVKRESLMAKTLFAVDELTGLITAAVLVRPEKKIENLEVKSVKKKLKDKAFAAAVSREDINKGAEELGIELDEHIANVISAMRKISEELGL